MKIENRQNKTTKTSNNNRVGGIYGINKRKRN